MLKEGEDQDAEIISANWIIQRLSPIDQEHTLLVNNDLLIFMLNQGLEVFYPDFQNWYNSKVVPGFATGERLIHIAQGKDDIYGASIIKVSPEETKLCNFVVAKEKRRQGIGKRLIKETLQATRSEVLIHNYSPDIGATISEDTAHVDQIDSPLNFLKRFGFEITGLLTDEYREGVKEYILSAKL